MALYSNLKDYRFNDTDVDDIRGAAVYGVNDEKLGKIEDVIFDNASGELSYVVLDSGGWLSTKKFLVPARQLTIREEADKDFHVNLTKEQIERFPEFNEKQIESEKEFQDYENRYQTSWADSPIMHREGSTHAITPETVVGPGGGDGMHHASPRRIAHDMPRFGATSSSDTTDGVSLAGEIDRTPSTSGSRNTIGRLVGEPVSAAETSDPKIDSDGYARNPRARTFETWLRKYREDILRKRREDTAA